MNHAELVAVCRVQAATLLLAYHDALNTTLRELVELLPPIGSQGQEPYRLVLDRFTLKVLALSAGWSKP